jgi:hypothetical protein
VTKTWLLVTIGAAVLVVAALAALTPTVIAGGGGREAVVRVAAPPGWTPYAPVPYGRPFGNLRDCLRKHGIQVPPGGGLPPPRTLRDALRACRGVAPALPGLP